MNIQYFERNDADQIVAIEGSERLILPFSFVADFKPIVGDYVFQEGDEFHHSKEAPLEVISEEVAIEVLEVIPEEVSESPIV